MATQAGMGLTRVLILALAGGYGGSILLRNGKLSDILAELQTVMKGSGSGTDSDSDYGDITNQLRRLTMDVRQLSSARQITVLNSGQTGNITALVIPAAALGTLAYGYMWWKGLSFSDLMYVTKGNMTKAVASMTTHLENLSGALAAAKRHLTQRIEGLDVKLDEQKEISIEIQKEVTDARDKLTNIGFDLSCIHQLVGGLNVKMNTIEDKQNFACAGVMYLCQYIEGKDQKIPYRLQDGNKPTNKQNFIGGIETRNSKFSLQGLQQITEVIDSGNYDRTKTEAILQGEIESLSNQTGLPRDPSIKS